MFFGAKKKTARHFRTAFTTGAERITLLSVSASGTFLFSASVFPVGLFSWIFPALPFTRFSVPRPVVNAFAYEILTYNV